MLPPRLSICIPTYNYGEFIGATLTSVADQFTDGLEVVVVDGGSTDCTPEVVRSFEERLPGMRYIRLTARGGIDRDMAHTVAVATGEYCWLLSSDDVLRPGAIGAALKAFEAGGDILLCNRTECDIHLQPRRNRYWLRKSIGSRSCVFRDGNDFKAYFRDARSLGAIFSYMSSIIFRRELWHKVAYDGSLDDTNYAHVYRLFAMLRQGARLLYMRDPLVLCRGDNDSFAAGGLAKRIALDLNGYKRISDQLFVEEDVRKSFLEVMQREHPWHRIARLRSEAGGIEQWSAFKERLSQCGYGRTSLFVASLLGSSKMLINGLHLVGRAVRKVRAIW